MRIFSGDKGGIGVKGSEHKGMAGMKGAPGPVGPNGDRGHKGVKDLYFHNGTKQLQNRFIKSTSCVPCDARTCKHTYRTL